MTYSLLLHYFLIVHPLLSGMTQFNLPEDWSKDFTITLSRGGGRFDNQLDISFTYDSCKFQHRFKEKQTKNTFKMTSGDRAEVLKKLHDLKVTKIEMDDAVVLSYDKVTSSIAFKNKEESFYIQDGASSKIKERYEKDFNLAFNYLQMFAKKKH